MSKAVLLDTHSLMWLLAGEELGPDAKAQIGTSEFDAIVAVSAYTFWEVAMLVRKRRIAMSSPLLDWRDQVLAKGIREFPVTGEIAIKAETLVDFHPDPADRLIVATAMQFGLTLITADEAILAWPGVLERQDAKK